MDVVFLSDPCLYGNGISTIKIVIYICFLYFLSSVCYCVCVYECEWVWMCLCLCVCLSVCGECVNCGALGMIDRSVWEHNSSNVMPTPSHTEHCMQVTPIYLLEKSPFDILNVYLISALFNNIINKTIATKIWMKNNKQSLRSYY